MSAVVPPSFLFSGSKPSPLITPHSQAEWLLYLQCAPVNTVLRDRDGDIWRRWFEHTDDGMTWKRRGGGWAGPLEVAHWFPFVELAFDPGGEP